MPIAAVGIARIAARAAIQVAAGPRADAPFDLLVVVPARNEAAVVGDVIADLGAQDVLPGARGVAVVIVDDASRDDTAAVAATAIAAAGLDDRARLLRRPIATTKGAAVQAGIDAAIAAGSVSPSRSTLVIVLDADAQVAPDFLRRASSIGRLGPATARRRMMKPPAGSSVVARWLAEVQEAEQAIDASVQAARWAIGGASELRGDGVILPLEELRVVGGFPTEALCEDLELSTALYLDAGRATRPALDLWVWEQPVITVGALARQRLRWAEGAIRRDLGRVLPRLLDARIPLGRRLEPAFYAAQTLLGQLVLGLALGAATRRARSAVAAAVGLPAAYAAGAVVLAISVTPGPWRFRRLRTAGSVVGFAVSWPVVTTLAWWRVAIRRRPSPFVRTEKIAGFEPPEVPRHDGGDGGDGVGPTAS